MMNLTIRHFMHAALSLALSLPLNGAEIETHDWSALSGRNIGRQPKGWVVNSKFSPGEAAIAGADAGTALKITVPGEATGPLHLYNRTFMKVTPESRIVVKVLASGRGSLGVVAYVYDEDEASLGIVPKADTAMQAVEGEKFSEFTYTLNVADSTFRKGSPANVRLAILVSPGAEIEVQSLTVTAQ